MTRALAIAACLAAACAAVPPAAARATAVRAMVAGKDRVLRQATTVTLKQRRVTVGAKRCAVGAGTPLGVLAGLHLTLRVRDYYGSCGRRARDAGGLFVTRVGPDRNRGASGWVYKLGRRGGSSGAADPAGPFGTGRRLRAGDRLLWFWCRADPSGGCQRTLEATPDRTTAAPGDAVHVTVRGYDNDGHGVPVGGATVRLGSASALTGADGAATLTVPGAGRLRLSATAPGLVPAFPGTVEAG
jgi:hypothetical protein